MSSESWPVLEMRGVSVDYGRWRALVDVDLALGAGDRVCLVGPNGAGKSTLVRCLTGLVPPSSGSVLMAGRQLRSVPRAELARRIAVVPGSARLPFAMTVSQVVALGRTPYLRGWSGPSAADMAVVTVSLGRAGILSLRDRDVRTLSMGERQMTLIAMALAQGGDTLILDEPTVHLDLRHQVEVMELLTRLSDEDGMTILAVLHDLSMAAACFPRIAMLDHGRMVADGPSRSVLTADRIRDVYGVEPRFINGIGLAGPSVQSVA